MIYVDESGDCGFSANNTYTPNATPTRFFIRVGIIIHDWKWTRIDAAIKSFKQRYHVPKAVELHATAIRSGKELFYNSNGERKSRTNWFGATFHRREDRNAILLDFYRQINNLEITILCVAIDKTKIRTTHVDYKNLPKNRSWEFLIERANLFLDDATDKRAMIISDAVHQGIEKEYRDFASALYAQSLHIKSFHFVESILFEPSESSNLLQLADIVSYAFGRNFNSGDDTFLREINSKIFQRQGVVDGCGLKEWPE